MALKGIDIFKLTPKKNCKECGSPTCMAFAMKVAQGAADIAACPYMSDDAKAQPVSTNDILDIISKVKSSVSEAERKRYEDLKSFESVL